MSVDQLAAGRAQRLSWTPLPGTEEYLAELAARQPPLSPEHLRVRRAALARLSARRRRAARLLAGQALHSRVVSRLFEESPVFALPDEDQRILFALLSRIEATRAAG